MGGLLDKAKSASSDEKSTTKSKTESATLLSGEVKSKNSNAATVAVQQDGPDIPMILNIAGWIIIVLGAIFSLQGGGFGLIVVLVVLALGIGSIVQSQRMTGGISPVKTGISVALAFVIAVGPYAAIMIVPTNASMAVTEITIDEDEDVISFVVRGSFSEADAKVYADGAEVWSGSKSMANDRASFDVSISTIFQGNSLDYTANVVKEYTIEVESSDGQKITTDIDPDFTTREVLNSATRVSKVLKSSTSGSGGGTSSTVTDGLTIEAIVGLFSPSESEQDGGGHTLDNLGLIPVTSDYSFKMTIKKGSSTKYVMPTVTVNGLDAQWSSSLSGTQTGKANGWLGMPGTALNDLSTEYLQKDDFYDGSGCYTFEIEVTNQFYAGNTATSYTSTSSWELDLHPEDSTQDGEMTTC
tara:strand:- start:139 stop:1377 length:1239 start_codon:yes stop_codon:yes gene_type:complete